jgi:hypothetical protein
VRICECQMHENDLPFLSKFSRAGTLQPLIRSTPLSIQTLPVWLEKK